MRDSSGLRSPRHYPASLASDEGCVRINLKYQGSYPVMMLEIGLFFCSGSTVTTSISRLLPVILLKYTDQQEKARVGYFEQKVAPTVSPDKVPALRKEWNQKTALVRPATPAPGVASPNANVAAPLSLLRPTTARQSIRQTNGV